jgi:hypothetical protein
VTMTAYIFNLLQILRLAADTHDLSPGEKDAEFTDYGSAGQAYRRENP